MYTREDMEKCFEAGVKFGRDMFNNPSNTEYMSIIKNPKKSVCTACGSNKHIKNGKYRECKKCMTMF